MLKGLYLSNNLLSGELPDCWMKFDQLQSLHLENNKFSGNIPASIGALYQVQYLILRNNSLSGNLPSSLENCTYMVILDVGYNSLTGSIPSNIGNVFGGLGILNLRENKFYGRLPLSLCQMSNLQILDVASNHISGTIPECIYNLTAMIYGSDYLTSMDVEDPKVGEVDTLPYGESAVIEWKREEQRFDKAVNLYILIDLSRNELEGRIPDGITLLKGLISVDFSRNKLYGSIPSNISQLTLLEFLDLSNNHLSGAIPISLTQLTYLGTLNLSNNNLSGKIPYGTQLQSFDPSSYMGNPSLCGEPLKECPGDEHPATKPNRENITPKGEHEHGLGNGNFYLGLYISVVLGFIIGFWGVCGSIVLKRSWRHAFFRFFDNMKDKLYVMVFVNVARVWRKP